MANSRRIRVDDSLLKEFDRIAKPIAEKVKKDYGLPMVTIDYPTISRMVCMKLHKSELKFKLIKTSNKTGILRFL